LEPNKGLDVFFIVTVLIGNLVVFERATVDLSIISDKIELEDEDDDEEDDEDDPLVVDDYQLLPLFEENEPLELSPLLTVDELFLLTKLDNDEIALEIGLVVVLITVVVDPLLLLFELPEFDDELDELEDNEF
jgi:hypothetical protein